MRSTAPWPSSALSLWTLDAAYPPAGAAVLYLYTWATHIPCTSLPHASFNPALNLRRRQDLQRIT